ncbi:hypothetical protein TRFO_33809 [Tritrichomonas foetus]|uniref:Uncharacterized protein n=1 Tax=Tritrichomonas foetus TaxID=1144522 RepID=A0A1J4JKT6_9EUKA|nr:hypothetical protein TRFO_33809 [Tritrichomonas foetus]|eukprot:OHS99728.1 hypothetical protein TRFO_33809 [Tritrichomonas foetus]
MSHRREALVAFFKLFPVDVEITDFESMKNCVAAVALYQYFSGSEINIANIKTAAEKNDWFNTLKEIRTIGSALEESLKKSPYESKKIDVTAIAHRGDLNAIENFLTQLAYYSFKSAKKTEAIGVIKKLSKEHQIEMKYVIKPDAAPANSPSTAQSNGQSNSPSTPVRTAQHEQVSNSPSRTPDVVLNELKSKIEALTKSNESLRSENDKLRNEINDIKSGNTENTENSEAADENEHILPKIAAINAELFVLEQGNKSKQGKKQQLVDIQEHLKTVQSNLEKAKNEAKELQAKVDSEENRGPDYTILHDRLQQLRLDPKAQEVESLKDQIKEAKIKLRAANKQKQRLQAKLDGQQGIIVLEDRKRFQQQLEVSNAKRKQRAELHLALSQKKMRSDAFLQEMRAFI